MKLTDATIAELRCPEGKKDVMFFDDQLKGFGIRVMPDHKDGRARKVFLLQYRADGKVRRETIGDWGSELSTAQARRRAETLRGQVRDRRDPVAERKAAAAARRIAEAEARLVEAANAFTLRKLVDAWESRSLSLRRESYRKEATARVRQGLATLLDRPAGKITRIEAAKALQEIAEERGPIAANRLMAYVRACYGWAIKANLLEANPFANLAAPGKEKARNRVLTRPELQAIWTACDALEPVPAGYVRFLMLTLQRRQEVAGATWSEISVDGETWTIPAARAKNGRAHLVHLAPAARAVLKLARVEREKRIQVATKEDRPAPDLVFATPIGTKLTAFSVIKADLDAAITAAEEKAAAEEGREPVKMPGWVFHDFRRAGVTALADAGFPPHVCDRLLNHVTGAIQGVAAVYQRAEFLAERKAALEAWAKAVTVNGSICQLPS